MKKLFLASITLLLFAISIVIVQISCSKSEAQNRPSGITSFDKILYSFNANPDGVEFWTANIDGSNQAKINLVLPPAVTLNRYVNEVNPKLSPDGTKLYFRAYDSTTSRFGIYRANIDGSAVINIITLPQLTGNQVLHDVY